MNKKSNIETLLKLLRSGDRNTVLKAAKLLRENHYLPNETLLDFDLSGIDLHEIDLSGVNLNGINLREADLSQANLKGARLKQANLYGTNLYGANLHEADLRGSHLDGANLVGANLSSADLSKIDLRTTKLDEAYLFQSDMRGANLAGKYLSSADLSSVNLSGANLSGADLNEADLSGANLSGADFSEANLIRADLLLANITGANFRKTDLFGVNLTSLNLNKIDFSGANLAEANLNGLDLSGSILTGADLSGATLIYTNLSGANLSNAHIFGVAAWKVILDNTIQSDLVITQYNEPTITVDNLEVAQFVYLLLNNKNIRGVIDTITAKTVLILGRFTDERKAVLDAIREEIRKHNYTPILFDFEKPASRDLTETIMTLAGMARFVIADITDAKSIPQELQAVVPNLLSVAVQPIILKDQQEYAMFERFKRFPQVLPVYEYEGQDELISVLYEKVIQPAEEKVKALRPG